jgi:pimeloyl-ACP methyl ester carboxylesterase
VDWTEEQLSRMLKLVDTPVRWFEARAEALERFVLVNGLKGIVNPSSDGAASGIVEHDGRFRLAADNRAAMAARASTREIHRVAHAPVVLAAGEHDNMVSHEEQRSLDPAAVILPGLGHNAHVENPRAFWELLRKAAAL